MNPEVYSLAATMINQFNRVDILSNNLANLNTNGFKSENLIEGSFNNYLQKATTKTSPQTHTINQIINTVPKIDGSFTNSQIGTFVETNNQLDFSLSNPNTFFKIQSQNGDVLLTRDGSFKSLNGFLVTMQGERVLNNENEPILIEDGFEQQISLVQASYNDIFKVGSNNYQHRNINQLENIADLENQIIQGSLEKSNVNPVQSMVLLIETHRRLELAQKSMMGIDETNEKLLQKIDGR